jgi:hypothetical protein
MPPFPALSVNRSLIRESSPCGKPREIFLTVGTGFPDCLILNKAALRGASNMMNDDRRVADILA